jgi:hypothetical protein
MRGADAAVTNGADYQALAEQVKKIVPKYTYAPYEHDAARKLFDVNAYFTILNHLKVNDRFQLDYIYCALPRYGRPYIYKRNKGSAPFETRTACSILDDIKWQSDAVDQMSTRFMGAVDADGTPESFIQFAILYLIGDHFFLFDHAGYNDDEVILSKLKMDEVLNAKLPFGKKVLPDDVKAEAMKIDVTPTIEEGKEHDMIHVTVKVITFSKWRGFQRRSFVFNKELRNYLESTKTETIVPYDIGVRF